MNTQEQMERLRGQRASEWYDLLHGDEATSHDRKEFAAWIAESPLNSAAYYKITALDLELRKAAREVGLSGWPSVAELNPGAVIALPDRSARHATSPTRKNSLRWVVGVAAAAAAVLTIGIWLNRDSLQTQHYATATGEERTVSLRDGSILYLNAQSSARVQFTSRARNVELTGEALFKVAHDPQRPFEVHTREAVIRVVGTEFNVLTRADGTRIAVLEGRVRVSSEASALNGVAGTPSAAERQPAALSAGEAVRVWPSGAIERRPASEVAAAVAWREHLINIDGMRLEDAVAEFNRYQPSLQLRLENVTPGLHHYSGTFDAQDPRSFVDFLAHERDLEVDRSEHEIVIRERR